MMLYEKERNELIKTARTMEAYGLVRMSGGNDGMRT